MRKIITMIIICLMYSFSAFAQDEWRLIHQTSVSYIIELKTSMFMRLGTMSGKISFMNNEGVSQTRKEIECVEWDYTMETGDCDVAIRDNNFNVIRKYHFNNCYIIKYANWKYKKDYSYVIYDNDGNKVFQINEGQMDIDIISYS